MRTSLHFFLLIFLSFSLNAQQNIFEGYVYDSEHEDRLKDVKIDVYQGESLISGDHETDYEGKFSIDVPQSDTYKIIFNRQAYQPKTIVIDFGKNQPSNHAIPMIHLEGYEFTGLIQEYTADNKIIGEAINNTKIEIYNKTTGEQEMTIANQADPNFVYHFEKKNHYIIQVKKPGYYTKRIEAVVERDGCTICLDGIAPHNLSGIYDNDESQEPLSSSITGRITLRKINLDEIIEIENIYYNYDKATIKETAKPALNNLVNVLKTTPIIIELSSHTDSRGDDAYNQDLSLRRAQSAVDYIVSRGISRDRLTANGYGESRLVNECANDVPCSEAKHQKNRRTEFKVVKLMEEGFDGNKSLKEIVETEPTK